MSSFKLGTQSNLNHILLSGNFYSFQLEPYLFTLDGCGMRYFAISISAS